MLVPDTNLFNIIEFYLALFFQFEACSCKLQSTHNAASMPEDNLSKQSTTEVIQVTFLTYSLHHILSH